MLTDRNAWTSRLTGAVALAGTLLLVAGCSEPVQTAPADLAEARLWIDDGPDKPATNIQFSLAQAARVLLMVKTPAGEHVTTLVDDVLPAGVHVVVWDGRDDDGRAVASGPYWAMLVVEGEVVARAMMMVK